MSDPTSTIGPAQDEFRLAPHADSSLSDLVAQGDFDDVHFFIEEALDDGAIDIAIPDSDREFALLPYAHPDQAIHAEAFQQLEARGFHAANFRDLLTLAIERPALQMEYDIVALDTLRTRQIFQGRQGRTVWDQKELDKSICQWATGLSNLKQKRTLVPVEIFLDKVLRKDTLLLVRTD